MGDSFVGAAQPLTQDGISQTCEELTIPSAALWAVLSVETSGCGFLSDRRPRILFERHIFSRLTHREFDQTHPDISNPSPGGYGASGANQYLRLEAAMALNRDAALQSASWGIGQIMGFNFAAAGCSDVGTLVTTTCQSESAQLACMSAFIRTKGMHASLQAQDWRAFAQAYNGPNYAQNAYDTKLATYYERYVSGPLPDLDVRAAQMLLMYRGYTVGPIDGLMGAQTRAALRSFQSDTGMEATGNLDDATMGKLNG